LTEGTSGVEPAGEAERATAAKFEALVSWAQGVARHEVERLPHEGKHVHELPQKGERKPEGPPRKSERMAKTYPQKGEHKIKMPSTGEGGGKPKRNAEMPPRWDERELKCFRCCHYCTVLYRRAKRT
jgi:hypothetical protein